jgi:hypothetical protein
MGTLNKCKSSDTQILKNKCIWQALVAQACDPQDAEIRRIRRITVGSQPGQMVHKTLSRKKPITKKGWWRGSR